MGGWESAVAGHTSSLRGTPCRKPSRRHSGGIRSRRDQDGGSDVTITDNHINGNGAPGIWTDDDGTGDVIAGNTVSGNTIGIEIR